MSWSFVLILCVAISLMLGPVMLLRPSPEQKRREALRLAARSLGLQFTQRKLPIVAGDQETHPALITVYFIPPAEKNLHEDWLLMRATYTHELHILGHWTWMGPQRASAEELIQLLEFLPDLPDSIQAVSGGRSGYSVYWTEKGDNHLVQRIANFLQAIKKL